MTLIGGYLGAGKTTLLNHLLATTDQRLTVLVNDVGAIAVDASLLASRSDNTIELTNGCVCCSLTDGFAEALEVVRDRPAPDHLVVELSGVAEPARVAPFASTAGFTPNGVVILVDVDQVVRRHDDPRTADVVERQLTAADLVLYTKSDLAEPAEAAAARRLVASLAPWAPGIDAPNGEVPTNLVLGPKVVQDRPSVPTALPAHTSATTYAQVATEAELQRWLDSAPEGVVRVKGLVTCRDVGVVSVHKVGRRSRITAADEEPVGLVVVGVPGSEDEVVSYAARAPRG